VGATAPVPVYSPPVQLPVLSAVCQSRRPVARHLHDACSLRPALPSGRQLSLPPPPVPLATPSSVLPAWPAPQGKSPSAPAVASGPPPTAGATGHGPVGCPPTEGMSSTASAPAATLDATASRPAVDSASPSTAVPTDP